MTMVRARMWPASPQFPRLAFSFELMDWVEALLLECQVAVKEFCGALYFKCPYVIRMFYSISVGLIHMLLYNWLQRKEIYNSMIDAAEEYR